VNKPADLTKAMQDMMQAFPMDTSAMQKAFRTQGAMGEKLSRVALEAAERATDISARMTKGLIARMGEVVKTRTEPGEYTRAMSDFASAASELATEHMAAFAEVAKKVQMETVELMLAAGKDLSEETTAAVKKATSDVASAAKKATAPGTASATAI